MLKVENSGDKLHTIHNFAKELRYKFLKQGPPGEQTKTPAHSRAQSPRASEKPGEEKQEGEESQRRN